MRVALHIAGFAAGFIAPEVLAPGQQAAGRGYAPYNPSPIEGRYSPAQALDGTVRYEYVAIPVVESQTSRPTFLQALAFVGSFCAALAVVGAKKSAARTPREDYDELLAMTEGTAPVVVEPFHAPLTVSMLSVVGQDGTEPDNTA